MDSNRVSEISWKIAALYEAIDEFNELISSKTEPYYPTEEALKKIGELNNAVARSLKKAREHKKVK